MEKEMWSEVYKVISHSFHRIYQGNIYFQYCKLSYVDKI